MEQSHYSPEFDRIYPFTHNWEKGTVDDKDDPGGLTKDGISFRFLQNLPIQYADVNGDHVINHQDIFALDDEKIKNIMHQYFFVRPRFDAMKCPRVQAVMFDFSVNSGTRMSVRFLQENLGVEQDGIIGPRTLGVLEGATDTPQKDYYQARYMLEDRERFLRGIVSERPKMGKFLQGWLNRCDALGRHIEGY